MARKSLLNKIPHIGVAAFAAMAVATAAVAQPAPCGQRTEIVEWLEETHAEHPVAFGLISNHELLEIHVSDTGSWTAVITHVTGRSCMVSAGHSWTPLERPVEGSATNATDAAGAR